MTRGLIREPEIARRSDAWVDLMEDALRWHRVAQDAVRRNDTKAAHEASRRRLDLVVEIARRCPDLTPVNVLSRLYLLSRAEEHTPSICPCGIGLVYGDAIAYSVAWHRAHRRVHVDTFPDVDARTVAILDENIARAESSSVAS